MEFGIPYLQTPLCFWLNNGRLANMTNFSFACCGSPDEVPNYSIDRICSSGRKDEVLHDMGRD